MNFCGATQYLQKFAAKQEERITGTESKKFILEEKKKMLNLSTSSRRFYVETKRNDKTQLEARLKILDLKKKILNFNPIQKAKKSGASNSKSAA